MLIVAFGYTLYVQTQIAELEREQAVLLEELGDFRNTDVNKIRLLKIETDDPYRFKWRYVLPCTRDFKDLFEFEISSSVTHHCRGYGGDEVVIRSAAIFFELDREISAVHLTGSNTAKHSFSKGNKLAGFLRKHWHELKFKVAGKKHVTEHPADQAIELFALWVPPKLIKQFEDEFSGPIVDQVKSGPLFKYTIYRR